MDHSYLDQAVVIALVAAAGAAFTWIMIVALARPTGPVTLNAQGAVINVSRDGALLPQVRERTTVRAMPEKAQPAHDTYMPGDVAPVAGTYYPVGRLKRRDPDFGVGPVATGLVVAHETLMESGDVFPPLAGYEAGAAWARESARSH